jgi:hypothetical protein
MGRLAAHWMLRSGASVQLNLKLYVCMHLGCVLAAAELATEATGTKGRLFTTEAIYVHLTETVCLLGYRSRRPGSIPGATRFSEKQWVWKGIHSASWVQLRSYLQEKVAAPV